MKSGGGNIISTEYYIGRSASELLLHLEELCGPADGRSGKVKGQILHVTQSTVTKGVW